MKIRQYTKCTLKTYTVMVSKLTDMPYLLFHSIYPTEKENHKPMLKPNDPSNM